MFSFLAFALVLGILLWRHSLVFCFSETCRASRKREKKVGDSVCVVATKRPKRFEALELLAAKRTAVALRNGERQKRKRKGRGKRREEEKQNKRRVQHSLRSGVSARDE